LSFFGAGFVAFRVTFFTAFRAFFGASFFVTVLGVSLPDTFFPLGTARLGFGSSFPSTTGTTVASDRVFMLLLCGYQTVELLGEECVIGEIDELGEKFW
jgi:hypothetical protein